MSAGRHLLLLVGQRLEVYVWRRGTLRQLAGFTMDIAGQAGFADYLASVSERPLRLLVDADDEAYVHETLPFLLGRDRRLLLARKLEQHFPGSDLRLVSSLGHEKTRRRNEHVLLRGLLQPATLEPWLGLLREHDGALASLHSVDQLGAPLVRRLGYAQSPCLLFDLRGERWRASFIATGQTRFSRLLKRPAEGVALASWLAAESERLKRYLHGQGLAALEDAYPLLVLTASTETSDAFAAAGPDIHCVDPAALAGRLRLHGEASAAAYAPYLALLGRQPPSEQFAPPALLHRHRLLGLEQRLLQAGLSLLLAGVLFAGHDFWRGHELAQQAQVATAERQRLIADKQALLAALPPLALDPASLGRLRDSHEHWRARQRLPEPALTRLGQALLALPAIALDHLEWKNVSLEASTVSQPGETLITLRGRVLPAGPGRTAPAAPVGQLLERLQAMPTLSARLVHAPLPVAGDQGAAFTLEILWRPQP